MSVPACSTGRRHPLVVASCGFIVGVLGGLIGLGGAEFRLPILIGCFRFDALRAVVLNKATSLVVVAAALLFRSKSIHPLRWRPAGT